MMSNRSLVLTSLACLLAAGLVAGPAQAQISPFRGTGPRMSQADSALMDKATEKLLGMPSVVKDTREEWRNPASGWSGSVTLTGEGRRGALECRMFSYLFAPPTRPDTRTYKVSWCRGKDGTWKLV